MKKSFSQQTVSHELAISVIKKAVEEGQRIGVPVSVAVVDAALQLIAFAKADGSTAHSVETSRRKAQTAASTRKDTGWMQDNLALSLPLAADNLLTNIPGGTPIVIDEVCVGGFGVAGGTVEQDAQVSSVVKDFIDKGE